VPETLKFFACLALCAPLLLTLPAAAQTALAAPAAPLAPRLAPSSYADPALEARVLAIAEELRCLVCQNETIAASHADLAVDLRNQIRIKLGEGQSQKQILDFMAERYGDFVLYRPRWQASTVLLWAGPFVLLLLAGWVLIRNIRRHRQSVAPGDLSAEESARVDALLAEPAAAESRSQS
jgi:cytochrome c-type biogenesis protein CcmH